MKAIVKATGEYIEVCRIQAVAGNNLYKDVNSCITYHPEELESIEIIRIKASIAAMQGLISNPQTAEQIDHDERYKQIRGGEKTQLVAIASMMYGNAFVEELQRKGGEQ